MADVIKLNPPGPPQYLPQGDRRDDPENEYMNLPPRTAKEEAIYRDWVSKGKPEDYGFN